MEKQMINLLFKLFKQQENYSVFSRQSVDEFYSHVCFELESEHFLKALDIHRTSDLQRAFIRIDEQIKKKHFVHLLFTLYQDQMIYNLCDDQNVNDFYVYLSDNEFFGGLDSESLLHQMNIKCSNTLQLLLLDYSENLEGDLSDEAFEKKWLTTTIASPTM